MYDRFTWDWYPLALWEVVSGPLLGIGLLALIAYRFRLRGLRPLENACVAFADRTARYAGFVCFLVGFVVAMGIAMTLRQPEPQVHDEASYLLAADTFAHGRWTNPALPADIAAHFEALHIIVSPSYMSKYPPGQGLFLAGGMLVGDPTVSLWFGAGLCAAACYYLLGAFMPHRWAYAGGLLCALHPLVLKWAQSFWGGHLALIGGFLLLGSAGRLVRAADRTAAPRPLDAVAIALGLALLANTRPYEGVCVAGLIALLLLPALWRGLRGAARLWLLRVFAPAGALLVVTVALMLVYNQKVTGSALTMPYVIHEKLYGVAPLFWFQPLKPVPPTLRHDSMRVINARATALDYKFQHTFPHGFLMNAIIGKVSILFRSAFQLFDLTAYWLDAPPRTGDPWNTLRYLLRYVLFLPIFGAFLAARRRSQVGTRLALLALPVFAACVCLETFINPHYGAPAGGFVALVLVDGWRHLRAVRWRGRRIGLGLSRLVLLLVLASFVYHLTEFAEPRWHRLLQDRRPIVRTLERFPGTHLVLVYYGNKPLALSRNQEWVYNTSDFASQQVLWARYLTRIENRHLLSRFPERRPWVLNVADLDHITLLPYADFENTIARDDEAAQPSAARTR